MILKNEKIILRPIKVEDAPRYVKWLNKEIVRKFLSANINGITLKEEIEWIKSLEKKKNTEKHFAIDTKDGVHIGSVSLILDKKSQSARFGILIGDDSHWGKGYGVIISEMILDYGFIKLNLHRIELNVFDYNKRAIRLYEKIGFKKEGVKRDSVLWKGRFYDSIDMAILRKEWVGK